MMRVHFRDTLGRENSFLVEAKTCLEAERIGRYILQDKLAQIIGSELV